MNYINNPSGGLCCGLGESDRIEIAASLSQLATDGTSAPDKCQFPVPVDKVTLTEVIEIIPITAKAKKSIEEVPVWKK